MPSYDYVCTVCGHRMEVVHGIHGQGPEACPVCGGVMRKAFVVPTVHFKGSGWAKKDRGAAASTKAAAKAAAGDGSAASSGGDGSSAGSDGSSSGSASESTGSSASTGGAAKGGESGSGHAATTSAKPSGDGR